MTVIRGYLFIIHFHAKLNKKGKINNEKKDNHTHLFSAISLYEHLCAGYRFYTFQIYFW